MSREILREGSPRASSISTDYNSALIKTQNIWKVLFNSPFIFLKKIKRLDSLTFNSYFQEAIPPTEPCNVCMEDESGSGGSLLKFY